MIFIGAVVLLGLCYRWLLGRVINIMISYQSKTEIFTNLVSIFEEELEWIINK